jgi:xanthine dehydrogenase accessory factor
MDDFSILSYAQDVGKPAVLATLLHVEGHSYRKPGTAMLLLPDGGGIGSLSPGCLESDLQERACELLRTGEAELVTYNLKPEEDAIWGEAMGCGGILRILLEPLDDCSLNLLRDAYIHVEAGVAVEWIRYFAGRKIDYEMRTVPYDRQPRIDGSREREPLFSTRFFPRSRLFVFGAGEGTMPIARLARGIGFRVAVGDWRSSLCNAERFPNEQISVGTPQAIINELNVQAADYILICGHQMSKDRDMLERILPMNPAYLGVMGSANRIRHLLDGLSGTDGIHAPVGIGIGAEGPEEIAVSIVAQLISVRKRRRSEQEVNVIAYRRNLFGGGTEQANDRSQAFFGACAR